MTRKDAKSKPKPGVLERLAPAEASSVLSSLLDRHPDLQAEAEAIARAVLGEVSLFSVADDVENAVLQYDYDDLNARAGGHSWGYVEPTEAAWELLEEAVEPFVSDMKRYYEALFGDRTGGFGTEALRRYPARLVSRPGRREQ